MSVRLGIRENSHRGKPSPAATRTSAAPAKYGKTHWTVLYFGFGLALVLCVAMGASAQNLLKGSVTKQIDAKPEANLVDRYGDAASDPTVADALRKAQGQQTTEELKEKANTYEALQNGTFKPGADPTMALMYGYVPPNMTPERAQMLAKFLPRLPKMPNQLTPEQMAGEPEAQRTAIEPESPYIPYPESFPKARGIQSTRQLQMIPQQTFPGMPELPNVPGMPMMGFGSGTGYGLSREEIAVQNQKIAEECIRTRFGPVAIPTLQPGHNWLAEQARKNAVSQHVAQSDHQSIVGVCDASGNEITSIQYDPWGNHTVLSGGTVMPDFMFKGMYYLPRADLYLTPNRVYSSKLGRWLSRDPLGESAGTNLYAFANNNPVNFSDPLGLFAVLSYNVATTQLTVYDSTSGTTTSFPAGSIFSGNGQYQNDPGASGVPFNGPIPPGTYWITPEVQETAHYQDNGGPFTVPVYNLKGPGMSNTYPGGRSGAQIHPGTVSYGCMTFRSQVPPHAPNYPYSPAFNQLESILNSTSQMNVPYLRGGVLPWNQSSPGILIVK